jgi:hypothetical protein
MTETKLKFVIEGICKWAKVHQPGTDYNKNPQYSLDLYPVDMDAFKKDIIGAHGISQQIKTDADGNEYFQFRKKGITADGESLPGPTVVDSKKDVIDSSVLIGNGSRVKVAFSIVPYQLRTGQKGNKILFRGVQVLDLVHYEVDLGFDEEDGYTTEVGGTISDDADYAVGN